MCSNLSIHDASNGDMQKADPIQQKTANDDFDAMVENNRKVWDCGKLKLASGNIIRQIDSLVEIVACYAV